MPVGAEGVVRGCTAGVDDGAVIGATAAGVTGALGGVAVAVLVDGIVACLRAAAGGVPRSGGVMPELFAAALLVSVICAARVACGVGLRCDTVYHPDAPMAGSATTATPTQRAFDLAIRCTIPRSDAAAGKACAVAGDAVVASGSTGFGASDWATCGPSAAVAGLRSIVTDPVWGSVLMARAPMVAP
ncbi:hypothetical protein [Acetobacter okinawensis]|uniref:hypothetical protein n=1 Tax=Acetobacter okinawensis TaxID=1076594 RepID=UPI000685AED9|nr:hypothetical protein [Acetobacter okinawensis]